LLFTFGTEHRLGTDTFLRLRLGLAGISYYEYLIHNPVFYAFSLKDEQKALLQRLISSFYNTTAIYSCFILLVKLGDFYCPFLL
jgi:hypothetical protein